MTRDRKALILIGAVLIGLLIAIAFFSLGVYVGVHGWTAGAPSVAGPARAANVQPGPIQPPQIVPTAKPTPTPAFIAQAGPLQGQPKPQMTGRVRSVSRDTVTLSTAEGSRLFELDPEVQVFRWDGRSEQPASLEEVLPGEHLAVYGRFVGDGGRRLVAARLLLLPPPLDQPVQP